MAKIALLFLFDYSGKDSFYLYGIFLERGYKSEPTAYSYAVRIGNDSGLFINITEKEVCNLSSDTRKFEKLVHLVGNGAVILAFEDLAHGNDVTGLGLVKTAGADDLFHIGKLGSGKIVDGFIFFKEYPGHDIDSGIGTLCTKHGGNQQSKWSFIV